MSRILAWSLWALMAITATSQVQVSPLTKQKNNKHNGYGPFSEKGVVTHFSLKKTEIFWLDSFLAYNSPLIPPQPPLFRSFISTFSYVVVFVCLGFSSLVVITCFLLYAFLCCSSHCRCRKEKWKTLGKCFRFFLKYVYVDREKNGESLIFWQSKK